MTDFTGCLRCGEPESERHHSWPAGKPEGWHTYLGQAYLDGLEDAILFAAEQKAMHKWEKTGITVLTATGFEEMVCSVCHGINWGGKNDGLCFGNSSAEMAKNLASNRRSYRFIDAQMKS